MTIALIDADILCHKCCYNRDDRSRIELDMDGNKILPTYTIEQDRKYMESIWRIFQSELEQVIENTFATDYCAAVKGDWNFRDDIYSEYKANRIKAGVARNEFVPAVRDLAIFEELVVPAHGREADDLLRIWAEECRGAGVDFIICSIDKDLLMIPGKHYNIKSGEVSVVTEEMGMRNYYEQLLKGDSTDNIPGIYNLGNVKAKKILADCKTELEFQNEVITQYVKAFGEDWASFLLSNGKMIHLQETLNDYFSFDNWPSAWDLIYD
jgi:5'-3' exonuclease